MPVIMVRVWLPASSTRRWWKSVSWVARVAGSGWGSVRVVSVVAREPRSRVRVVSVAWLASRRMAGGSSRVVAVWTSATVVPVCSRMRPA
jgi:hypothetical protein